MSTIDLIRYVPYDLSDGDLYEPLPSDHYSVGLAMKTFHTVADAIERVIDSQGPYEISIVGLKTSEPTPTPVILIGIARPDRIEDVLPTLDLSFQTHVRQSYPATFANNFDRNTRSIATLNQEDVPPIGTSIGAVDKDRHSVSLGAYITLSSNPKKVCVLTVPSTYKVCKGAGISQPSIADREEQYLRHNEKCKEVLDADPDQAAALRERRRRLEHTFEVGRIMEFRTYPSSSIDEDNTQPNDTVQGIMQHPSEVWLVAEVTRLTASQALQTRTPKTFPFKKVKPSPIRLLQLGTVASKHGRTTGRSIGTVNGVKSLYRLPRDGQGVCRFDYIVLSHPWGGTFGYPGDAGAIVMGHEPGDIENNTRITQAGRPCGMVVAASTSGHTTFVESLEDVTTGILRKGLGTITFLDIPRPREFGLPCITRWANISDFLWIYNLLYSLFEDKESRKGPLFLRAGRGFFVLFL